MSNTGAKQIVIISGLETLFLPCPHMTEFAEPYPSNFVVILYEIHVGFMEATSFLKYKKRQQNFSLLVSPVVHMEVISFG